MDRLTRVVLVDDHELIREGLKRILECDAQIKVVGDAANGLDGLLLIQTLRPDIVIADMNMPKMSGYELLVELRHQAIPTKIILLTIENQREILEKCIEAGADGYILKESAGQEIFKAIQQVMGGESYIDPVLVSMLFGRLRKAQNALTQENPLSQLTARELDVLLHMTLGKTNREIGQTLYLAEKTIKNHTTVIYRKLQVKDRVNAILCAVENQIRTFVPQDKDH